MGPAAQQLPPNERLPPLLLINLQLPNYPVRPPSAGTLHWHLHAMYSARSLPSCSEVVMHCLYAVMLLLSCVSACLCKPGYTVLLGSDSDYLPWQMCS